MHAKWTKKAKRGKQSKQKLCSFGVSWVKEPSLLSPKKYVNPEYGTDRLSQNVGKILLLLAPK
jgi:hypothetical protein